MKKLSTSERFDEMVRDGTINEESETAIQKRIIDNLNKIGIYGLWFRNSQVARGNHKGGLGEGTSDLIGIVPVVITEDMVGKTLGVFGALEVKRVRGGVATKKQRAFIASIRERGGLAGVASSVWSAIEVLKGKL